MQDDNNYWKPLSAEPLCPIKIYKKKVHSEIWYIHDKLIRNTCRYIHDNCQL